MHRYNIHPKHQFDKTLGDHESAINHPLKKKHKIWLGKNAGLGHSFESSTLQQVGQKAGTGAGGGAGVPETRKLQVTLGKRDGKYNPKNLRYYYRLLLQQEPIYYNIICHMMLIDYVCLPHYILPIQCIHMQSMVDDARKLLV